jgi:methionyl-tRNA synthetase
VFGGALYAITKRRQVRYGYHCEECEEAIWPATTRVELQWLKNREHIVREVAEHVSAGLDTWISESLDFLGHHRGHSIILARRN